MLEQKNNCFAHFILCLIFLSQSSMATADNIKTVSVLGYLTNLPSKLWQNSHVGFGIQNQLKQQIYDSERFNLKEEKNFNTRTSNINVNSPLTNITPEQNAEPWMLDIATISEQNLRKKSNANNLDLIFWVEILEFGNLNSQFIFGAFTSKTKKTTLIAKVCVFIQQSGIIMCETGAGKSRRTSNSFIYRKKDHRMGSKVFDGSMVGKISNVAVEKAVLNLLAKI